MRMNRKLLCLLLCQLPWEDDAQAHDTLRELLDVNLPVAVQIQVVEERFDDILVDLRDGNISLKAAIRWPSPLGSSA